METFYGLQSGLKAKPPKAVLAHLKNPAIIRDARGVTKRHKKSARLRSETARQIHW